MHASEYCLNMTLILDTVNCTKQWTNQQSLTKTFYQLYVFMNEQGSFYTKRITYSFRDMPTGRYLYVINWTNNIRCGYSALPCLHPTPPRCLTARTPFSNPLMSYLVRVITSHPHKRFNWTEERNFPLSKP